jgi:small basic protein
MKVMALYVVFIVAGAVLSWGLGAVAARYSDALSLSVFLACFFLNFVVSWVLAIWLTEPKPAH